MKPWKKDSVSSITSIPFGSVLLKYSVLVIRFQKHLKEESLEITSQSRSDLLWFYKLFLVVHSDRKGGRQGADCSLEASIQQSIVGVFTPENIVLVLVLTRGTSEGSPHN